MALTSFLEALQAYIQEAVLDGVDAHITSEHEIGDASSSAELRKAWARVITEADQLFGRLEYEP